MMVSGTRTRPKKGGCKVLKFYGYYLKKNMGQNFKNLKR
jgi:hypothetical protein